MNGVFVVIGAAFLLGSIPFGVIFARIFGREDIRKSGSGNIGATNVSRVLGFWPAGFLTFLGDTLKGTLAVFLASEAGVDLLSGWTLFPGSAWVQGSPMLQWCSATVAVLGHCFTPWLQLRGGKGVATGFGALILLSPWASLVGLFGFVMTFLATRVGSLSSLSGLFLLVVSHIALPGFEAGAHLLWGAALVFIVMARHEKNLDALLESRENRF